MSELCFGCMKEYENGSVCPHCGFSNETHQALPFLPLGTLLRDRYIVGKMIKSDCQGAEYICYDDELKTPVLLREFLPEGICGRSKNSGVNVVVKSESKELYNTMIKSFLSYFRTIARLRDLTAIATIYDIFTDNNTAYTVEDYEELISFKEFIKRSGGSLEWNVARPLFMPLISTLETVNKNGVQHLGLSPDNVAVTSEGKLILRNFMIPEMRVASKTFHSNLIEGCSSPEQYENKKLSEQSDVYGFSAVLFYSLTGNLPESYSIRKNNPKLLINTNVVKRLPPHVVTALANGLQIETEKRISSFEEYKLLLTSAPTIKAMRDEIKTEVKANKVIEKEEKARRGVPTVVWGVITFVTCAVLFFFIGNTFLNQSFFDNIISSEKDKTDVVSVITKDTTGQTVSTVEETQNFVVPDLTKMSYDDIIELDEKNKDFNIVFSSSNEFSDTVKKNYPIKQSPEAETELPVGSVIIVTLSSGAEKRYLPDIKEVTLKYAADILAEEDFVTYVEREYSDTVKEGYVINYLGNSAGDELDCGSGVTVIVSKGKENKSDNSLDDSDSES
ncbi:MAG: PASTA domain-containing protein [Clostridia bacterium]|nr:PASTA domain-containing protein [Clostridia bacterium]